MTRSRRSARSTSAASSSSSAAWRPATPSSASSAPTTTRATRSRSAAASPTRATSRRRASATTSAAATRRRGPTCTRADLDALGGVEAVMREITRRISFGMGVPAQERVDHPVLERIRTRGLRAAAEARAARRVAARHRRLGQPLRQPDGGRGRAASGSASTSARAASATRRRRASSRSRRACRFDGRAHEGEMDSPPVLFEIGSELGESYVAAMELAGEYAYAGRDVVVDKVLEILGAECDARGAQPPQLRVAGGALRPHVLGHPQGLHAGPAGPGGLRRRLDGRRVGDPRGRRVARRTSEALYSTVHGAGRVMSRSQAAGRVRRRKRWTCRNRDCDRVFDGEAPARTTRTRA